MSARGGPVRRLLLLLLALAPVPAAAQTTVNPGALDQLAPAPAAPSDTPAPTRKPPRKNTVAKPPAKPAAKPDARAAKPAPPAVPPAPPPAPVLPPPIAVPTRPTPPVVPTAPTKDAPGAASPLAGGMRVTFGVGRAELNPASDAAVRSLVHAPAAANPAATYTITAYAGGNADDPSTPRRLALARALAVRDLLMAEGVASARIVVRALGPPPEGDASPDRVDVLAAAPAQAR